MLNIEYLDWKNYRQYKNEKVIKRLDKLNSLVIFKAEGAVMDFNYYYLFEDLRKKRNNKNKELFKLVDNVFFNDSIIHYLINHKRFQKFYSACKQVQNILLKENKLQENKKRKDKVMNLFK